MESFHVENVVPIRDPMPISTPVVVTPVALPSSNSISPVQSCCGQSTTNLGSPSHSHHHRRNIVRTFLTPPLMRKRKENASNLSDSMSQLSSSLPGSSNANKSKSSSGFLGLFKVSSCI